MRVRVISTIDEKIVTLPSGYNKELINNLINLGLVEEVKEEQTLAEKFHSRLQEGINYNLLPKTLEEIARLHYLARFDEVILGKDICGCCRELRKIFEEGKA